MKLHPKAGLQFLITIMLSAIFTFSSTAQKNNLDWANDTISKGDAIGGKNSYLNTIRGSGQNATEQINLPVDKLKEIIDACAANNISTVAVMIISLRQSDIQRYKKNNPDIPSNLKDSDLKGRQMIVIKVPRSAFTAPMSQKGAKSNSRVANSLSASLLSAGLVQIKELYKELPFASGSYYFSFGSMCPPPAACDTEE
ncbi:MAG: hypothetical protein ABIP79_12105 [Chitinophagaceae bacterium]